MRPRTLAAVEFFVAQMGFSTASTSSVVIADAALAPILS